LKDTRWLEIAKNSTVVVSRLQKFAGILSTDSVLVSACQSTLLATIAAQLLALFKNDNNFTKRPTSQAAKDVLVTWSYIALLLNILAAFAAYVIIEKFTNRTQTSGHDKWLFFFCECSRRITRAVSLQ
jgi:hypothetical protein